MPAPVCSWMLAVAATLATLACRPPSTETEHGSASVVQEAEPAEPPRHGAPDADAPTTGADERSAPPSAPVAPEADPGAAAPGDPSTVEPEPEPEAKVARARRKKACRRIDLNRMGPLPDLVGVDEATVERCLGEPDRISGSTWHYRWPPGCSYEVTNFVVRFARGIVTSAHAEHEFTGEHCEPVF